MKRPFKSLLAVLMVFVFCSSQLSVFALETPSKPLAVPQKISLDYKNAELTDVLKAISYSFNVNIVVAKDVTGRVSAQLKDISLDEALKAILAVNNYSFIHKGSIIYIVPKSQVDLATETIPVSYLVAKDVSGMLKRASSDKGEIQVNEAINSLVVTDYPENIEKVKELLKDIDVMPIQVLIEVQIVSLSNSEFKNIGAKINSMNYNPTSGGFVYSYSGGSSSSGTGTGTGTGSSSSGINEFGVDYKYRGFDASLQINSLIEKSKGRVLASPSISTLSGLQASILIGEQVPYKNITTSANGNTESTQFASAGTTLNVTPTVSPDGFITMKIHPEVSQVVSILSAGPRIKTTSADATVRVRDRQTFVIGGLINRTDTANNSRDPLIGSIPLFGMLFQTRDRQKDESQVAVFITPHIIHSVEGIIYRNKFDRTFANGSELFDDLIDKGFMDKISADQAYLKKNIDLMKRSLKEAYPTDYEKILDIFEKTSSGQPELSHEASVNPKSANQDTLLLTNLLNYADGMEKEKTKGTPESFYASEELIKTYRMIVQEFPYSGKADYCLYRIALIYAKEFKNCKAAKETLTEMKDLSPTSVYIPVTDSLVDACLAVNTQSIRK